MVFLLYCHRHGIMGALRSDTSVIIAPRMWERNVICSYSCGETYCLDFQIYGHRNLTLWNTVLWRISENSSANVGTCHGASPDGVKHRTRPIAFTTKPHKHKTARATVSSTEGLRRHSLSCRLCAPCTTRSQDRGKDTGAANRHRQTL